MPGGSADPRLVTVRPKLPTALAVLLVLAAMAGCGGDSRRAETESVESSHASPAGVVPQRAGKKTSVPVAKVTDPRRRAYVARTDRICRSVDPERNTARARVGEAGDVGGAVKAYEEETALGTSELKQIEAVRPPPGDAGSLQANVFEPIRSQLVLRAQIRAALAAVDVPRLRVLRAELDDIGRSLSAFARGYGWQSCGEG